MSRFVPKWKPKSKRRTKSRNENVYKDPEWTQISKDFLKKHDICVWYGKRTNCTMKATITDHIHPLTDGGHPTDKNNLQPMCHSCSAAKTNYERQNRIIGMTKTITPNGLV